MFVLIYVPCLIAEDIVSRTFFLTLAVLAFAGNAAGQPQPTPTTQGPPVIVTTGEAVSKVTPDRAWITVSAESRSRSPREAQKLNAAAMTGVMQQLKTAGLQADAIRTTSVDLQPEFDFANGRQTLRGYVARNSIEIRVDTLSQLGEIIDAAVAAGATSLGGIRFDLKDQAAAEREALRRAIADARARAEAAASAAGVTIDRVVRIEDQRVSEIPPPRPLVMMRAEMAQQADTPISPGELQIKAIVTLTVAIK
jgi:uncharacterized protein YggE